MQLSIKYRPHKFSEIVGQDPSVRIMINSILMNRIPKSFLISGMHGSGKTSLARIYSAALNCENYINLGDTCGKTNPHKCPSCVEAQNGSHPSIIELDAASNNGVDDIRDLEKILFQKARPIPAPRANRAIHANPMKWIILSRPMEAIVTV